MKIIYFIQFFLYLQLFNNQLMKQKFHLYHFIQKEIDQVYNNLFSILFDLYYIHYNIINLNKQYI